MTKIVSLSPVPRWQQPRFMQSSNFEMEYSTKTFRQELDNPNESPWISWWNEIIRACPGTGINRIDWYNRRRQRKIWLGVLFRILCYSRMEPFSFGGVVVTGIIAYVLAKPGRCKDWGTCCTRFRASISRKKTPGSLPNCSAAHGTYFAEFASPKNTH